MSVRALTAADEPRYQAFVDAHAHGTLFHGLAWRDQVAAYRGGEPCYLLCEEAGAVRGVLPLFRARTLAGRALVSVPFAVYGGVLAQDAAAERALLDAAAAEARTLNVRHVELRYLHEPYVLDGASSALYVTFRRALPADVHACLEMIPRKSRAAARQARDKHGLQFIDARHDVAAFHDLFVLNKRALGSPVFSRGWFESLLQRLGQRALLHAVTHEGRIIAAVFSFVDRDAINPYYSGSLPGTERLGSMNFLYWQLMEEGVRRGLQCFDFGRSRVDTGAFQFKRNMGFEPLPLTYRYLLGPGAEIPSVNPSNPRFDQVKRIWSRLPLPLVRVLGPRLMRFFP